MYNSSKTTMKLLFENEDFRLLLTGHTYDFVGIIETKTDNPLTFFFSEELVPHDESDEEDRDGYDLDANIDESETELNEVCYNILSDEEADEEMFKCNAISYFRTRDDKSTGFLACPQDRGQFLALVKHYCPEKLNEVETAIY